MIYKIKHWEQVLRDYKHNLRDNNDEFHLSASVILKRRDQILFIFHPYLKMWLLPAGHVEKGESTKQTAVRELLEETGYQCELLRQVDVNLIGIPKNDLKKQEAHFHLDIRYLAIPTKKVGKAELKTKWLSKNQVTSEFRDYFV